MTACNKFPGVDGYMKPFLGFFHRSESRELAECYVTGLLMEGERKSVEPMSEKVHASERGMQRLLSEVKWDDAGVAARYRRNMLSATADPSGVLILGDIVFPKKGRDSVCVARQPCGDAGRIDNCQIGIAMTYVGCGIAWPCAMSLHVPAVWDRAGDAECIARRTKTRMPPEVRHRPKWQTALDLVESAQKERIPHRAVFAGSEYGACRDFRQALHALGEPYILGIHADNTVYLASPGCGDSPGGAASIEAPAIISENPPENPEPVRVGDIGERIAEDEWQRVESQTYFRHAALHAEAYAIKVRPAGDGPEEGRTGPALWLLIERTPGPQGTYELHYYYSNLPQYLPAFELSRLRRDLALTRESRLRLRKELGLNHHEGRSWAGWHRHALLVFLAYGYLTFQDLHAREILHRTDWRQRFSQF